MKKLSLYICFMLLCAGYSGAQSLSLPLINSHFLRYNSQLYVYGYKQQKTDLVFQCYKVSPALTITDSASVSLGKHLPADFLDITTDTLHDVLSFYFQKADQKNTATLWRLDPALHQLAYVENVDARRINTLTAFEDEKYAAGPSVYLVKTNGNEQNRQFFLSKFSVLSTGKPFEYKQDWQFAFERNYIHRASVVYANNDLVMVYVNVSDSSKKGQWLLKIDARSGELLKGIRLNKKNEAKNYLYSASVYNSKTKEFTCEGFVIDEAVLDFRKGTLQVAAWPKTTTVFMTRIDSMGQVAETFVKTLAMPLVPNKLNAQLTYHLKIRELQYFPTLKKMDTWFDVYEMGQDKVMKYFSSWYATRDESDINGALIPSAFYVSTSVIPGFIGSAKGDMYGKVWLGDGKQYDRFLYKKTLLPVVASTFINAAGNTVYILVKHDLNSGERTYQAVSMGKKGLEDKVLFRSGKSSDIMLLNSGTYISCRSDEGRAELSINAL
ncbi:MAG: hypothetical protein JST26_14275 [Bacteroidetes bacterium]|nr:hypothetical protein [Bacteroidota bacterium]